MTVTEQPVEYSHGEPATGDTVSAGEEHSGLPGARVSWDPNEPAGRRDEERDAPPVGKLLRELRADRTLRQVEAETGIANSYLSNLESGLKRPGVRTLAKLARYYEVPLMDFLEASGIHTEEDIPPGSPEEIAELRRSYAFVLADPLFDELPKPIGPVPLQCQELIVQMYQIYTGKRLL